MEPNYTLDKLEERAFEAKRINADLLASLEEAYLVRRKQRETCGVPPVGFCGMGRAGKDTAAEYICEHAGVLYPKSASWMVLPFIAHMIGIEPQQAWQERHQHREFWIAACHAFRGKDYTQLIRMCLGAGDVAVGIRGRLELDEAVRSKTVLLTVWIDNHRVPKDITVEYGPEDCDIMIPNHGSLLEFYAKLHRFVRAVYPAQKVKS